MPVMPAVDDTLTIEPPPACRMGSIDLADAPPGPEQIDPHRALEGLEALLVDRSRSEVDGGVVDQTVDRAEAIDRRRHDPVPTVGISDIVGDGHGVLAERVDNLLQAIVLQVGRHDPGALVHAGFEVPSPHALSRTRHDDRLAVKHCSNPPRPAGASHGGIAILADP